MRGRGVGFVLGLAVLGFPVARPGWGQEPIRIGGLFTLSGPASDLGIAGTEGAKLAVQEVNEGGGVLGRRLELIVTDEGSPQDAAINARQYVQRDGVRFLLGTASSATALAVSQVALENKTIFMATIAPTDALTRERWHRYLFRSGMSNAQVARTAARLMARKPPRRWVNLGPDTGDARELWKVFRTRLRELKPGVEVVGEQWVRPFTPDFTPFIDAVLQVRPDAVFNSLWGGDLVAFVRQAKRLAAFGKAAWVNVNGADVAVARALGEDYPDGIWAGQGYSFTWPDTPRNRAFVESYRKGYGGRYPSAWAAQSYDGIRFLVEAVQQANSLDTEKVVSALEGLCLEAPAGKACLRKEDHQMVAAYAWGRIGKDPRYPFKVVRALEIFPADQAIYSITEWKRARGEK